MKRYEMASQTMGFALVLFLTLFLVDSQADLGEIILKFQPYLSVQEEYTNNVDLTPKNKKSDMITTISPGIRFSTQPLSPKTGQRKQPSVEEEGAFGVDLDYRLSLVYYAKETDNNYIGQNGKLDAWYTPVPRLTFRLSEYLIRSEDPLEPEYPGVSPTYISGTFVDLTDLYLPGTDRNRYVYLRNVVAPSVEYRLRRDGIIGLLYRNNIYRPQDPREENSTENAINPRLVYWIDIRNGFSLDYTLTFGNFEFSPDLTGQIAKGRYTYRFDKRTSVFGEYRFDLVNFESPGVDYTVNNPSLGFEYALSPTLNGVVQFGWFWQSPRRGSGDNAPTYNVVLSQRGQRVTYGLLFQGGFKEDFFTSDNQGFTLYHRATGSVSYQFTEKITAGISGYFELDEYGLTRSGSLLGVKQRDKIWTASGNVAYKLLQWLTLSMNLSYLDNNSNIANQDYNEFRAMIKAEATLPR